MGRVPINTARVPQKRADMPMPGSDFGQEKIRAKAQQGQVIAKGIYDIGKEVAAQAPAAPPVETSVTQTEPVVTTTEAASVTIEPEDEPDDADEPDGIDGTDYEDLPF